MLHRTRLMRQRARRRLMRPALQRWHRRTPWRRSRRLVVATGVLLLIAGTTAVYKLLPADVQHIESCTGRPVEALADGELRLAMIRLDIQPLELTDAEAQLASLVVDDA